MKSRLYIIKAFALILFILSLSNNSICQSASTYNISYDKDYIIGNKEFGVGMINEEFTEPGYCFGESYLVFDISPSLSGLNFYFENFAPNQFDLNKHLVIKGHTYINSQCVEQSYMTPHPLEYYMPVNNSDTIYVFRINAFFFFHTYNLANSNNCEDLGCDDEYFSEVSNLDVTLFPHKFIDLELSCESIVGINISDVCVTSDFFSAHSDGSDLTISTNGIQNADFQAMMEANNINAITGNFLIDGILYTEEIYNENYASYIEQFELILQGIGHVDNIYIYLDISYQGEGFYTCPTVEVPIEYESAICRIFDLLRYTSTDGEHITFDFIDPNNPNYLIEGLESLGLTVAQAQEYFDNEVIVVNAVLNYNNVSGNYQNAFLDFSRSTGDPLSNFTMTFNVGDTTALEGYLNIQYNSGDNTPKHCQYRPITFGENQNTSNDDLPTKSCGDEHNAPTISNTNSLAELNVGMVISSNGMYFKITEVSSATAPFGGKGISSIPFGSKRLNVEFSGLQINDEKIVTSGTIYGIEGTPGQYPEFNLSPDTINFGGEICIPDPDPEDEEVEVLWPDDRGFNEDGTHINGTQWDENGFDVNGIHKDTETEYDSRGCNQEGLDADGQPCRQNDETTQLINNNVDTLSNDLPQIIQNIIQDFDKLLLSLNCNLTRDSMNTLLGGSLKHLDRKFIVGQNNEYFNEGMYRNFETKPEIINHYNSEKDKNVTELERLHVNLYNCDKDFAEITEIKQKLTKYTEEEIKALIVKTLKTYSLYQLEQFKKDQVLFISEVKEIMVKISSGEIVYHTRKPDRFKFWSQDQSYYNMIGGDIWTNPSSEDLIAEIDWMYQNNFQEIGGQHKGFYVEAIYNAMREEGILTGDDPENLLPLRISRNDLGVPYHIYFTGIEFKPNSTKMDVYFVFEDPKSGKRMVFSALDVEFNSGGIVGSPKLVLNSNIEIRLTNSAMLILNASGTEVSFDCNGFKSMKVQGAVELCREFVIPVDPATMTPTTDETDRYFVEFDVEIEKWEDFYVELNSTGNHRPFVLAKNKDLIWQVSDFVVDGSDLRSSTNSLKFEYQTAHTTTSGGASPTTRLSPSWKGLYIGTISVNFPSKIGGNTGSTTISAQDLLIDEFGVSVYAEIETTILSLDDGNAGGWPISIDRASVLVRKNRIAGGGFGGQLKIPMIKDPMGYKAEFLNGGVSLTVEPFAEDTEIPMLLATTTIKPNSSITMTYADNDLLIVAELNGNMNIAGGSESLYLPSITFTNLGMSNKAPYIQSGTWGLSGAGLKFGGFEIALLGMKEVNFDTTGTTNEYYGLNFNMSLGLASGGTDIDAKGDFDIIGKMQLVNDRQVWDFHKIKLNGLLVDVKANFGAIYGYLYRFDDPSTYGKGFEGMIDAQFKSMPKITVKGVFGKHQTGYKYFFLDAVVSGIKGLTMGPLEVNGFIGGVSYKMRRSDGVGMPTNPCVSNVPKTNTPGSSLTGSIYTPDNNIGLGFKFGACVQTTSNKNIFNGFVIIGMEFLSGGGINNMFLEGVGNIMADIKKIETGISNPIKDTKDQPTNSMISAHIRISYDFQKKDLHGKLVTFVNVNNQIKGKMGNNKAVDAEIRVNKNEWFIYIGTPNQPCALGLNVPLINVSIQAYLDIGTNVPNIPPLDPRINDILKLQPINEGFRNSGRGFAFGAKLEASMSIDAGIASASCLAILGFDVMVKDFGDTKCVGSQDVIGINGWYATGQLYAFIEGEIKALGITLIKAGFAAALQAQLPNPFYAQGAVGIRYKLFGKRKTTTAKFKLGEKCHVASSNPSGLDVIVDIDPFDGLKEVPTDYPINITFSVPVDKGPVTATDVNGQEQRYTISSDSILLTNAYTGATYSYTKEWNEDHTLLKIVPDVLFYADDSIKFNIKINIKSGQSTVSEKKVITFTTGQRINYLHKSNVIASYPLDKMGNFYQDESKDYKGYILLYQGIPELAYDSDKELKMVFTDGIKSIELPVEYNPIFREIIYDLPRNFFRNGRVYEFRLIHKDKADLSNLSFQANSDPNRYNKDPYLYKGTFRVSMYNTFDEKLDATLGSKTLEGNLLKYEILNESFDNLEYSDDIDEPLITTELKIDVDDFYKVAERAASIDWPHRITVEILSQESTTTSIKEDQIEVDVAGNIYIDKFLQYGIKSLKITNNRALFNNLKMGSDITEFPQKGSFIYIDGIDNVVNAMSDIKKKLDAAANGALDIFSFTEPQVIDQIMETNIPNNYINSVFKEAWLHYNLPGKYHKTSSIKLDTN